MYPNIEAERVRNGMKREELAEKIGISISTYYNWLAGRTAIPNTYLKIMAKLFGTTADYLLEERGEKNEKNNKQKTPQKSFRNNYQGGWKRKRGSFRKKNQEGSCKMEPLS